MAWSEADIVVAIYSVTRMRQWKWLVKPLTGIEVTTVALTVIRCAGAPRRPQLLWHNKSWIYIYFLNISGRLISGINQMKQIVSNRVSNPENNVDWSSHMNNIVSTATGIMKKIFYNILKNEASFFSSLCNKVGKSNLVPRHSVPHALPNFWDIMCPVAELNAAPCPPEWRLSPLPSCLQSHTVSLRRCYKISY